MHKLCSYQSVSRMKVEAAKTNVLEHSLSICFSFLHLLLGAWAPPRLPCIFDFQWVLQREVQMETWRVGRENGPGIHRYLRGHVWAVAVFFSQTPQLLLNGPSPKATALSRADSHSLPSHLQTERWDECSTMFTFILHMAPSLPASLNHTPQLCTLSFHYTSIPIFIHYGSVT